VDALAPLFGFRLACLAEEMRPADGTTDASPAGPVTERFQYPFAPAGAHPVTAWLFAGPVKVCMSIAALRPAKQID